MKSKRSRFFSNNKFIFAISLLSAFIFWFILAAQNTTQVSVKKNINISWDAAVKSMQQNYEDFKVITVDGEIPEIPTEIAVTVTGSASSVSSITDTDISITPDLTVFTEPGTQTVNLSAQIINSTFNNCTIAEIYPETVEVRVDQYVEKSEFTVQPQYVNLSLKSGLEKTFVLGAAILKNSENVIFISGPKSEIDSISSVVCLADFDDAEVDSDITQSGEVILYDAKGEVVSQEYLTLSYSQAEISVPVFAKKTVEITPKFINAPESFAKYYKFENNIVTVRGTTKNIEGLESITTKDIDFSKLKVGELNEINVELNIPSGISLIEDDSFAPKLTIDLRDFKTTKIAVKDVTLLNVSNNLTARLSQSCITIVVAAHKNEIKSISEQNLSISVDMSEQKTATSIELPVTVEIKDSNTAFVVSNDTPYTAEIEITN